MVARHSILWVAGSLYSGCFISGLHQVAQA